MTMAAKHVLLAGMVATIGGPAVAAPIYLSCEFDNGAFIVSHNWRLDEANGRASMTSSMGGVHPNMAAAFTADYVDVKDDVTRTVRFEYRINRRALLYTFTSIGTKFNRYEGRCAVQPTAGRKF